MVANLACNKDGRNIQSILNDDELSEDTVDTPKEGHEQHRKQEYLKSAISKGKELGGKKQWTHEKVHKAAMKTLTKHMLNTSNVN